MEWFSELIGFFIILFVFLVPLLRKLLIDKKRTEQKEEQIEVEEEVFYEEEEPELPLQPTVEWRPPTTERLVKKDFAFHTDFEERELESQIEARHLATQKAPQFRERLVGQDFILEKTGMRKKAARIDLIAKKQAAPRAMVILSEILGKPKGMS